jgi:type II secretory pathway pseudopilin PulG
MKLGFTVIEMLLVVAFIAMLAGISAPIYMSFQNRNELNVATTVLVQSLRRAQTLSRSMENDLSWGVYLEGNTLTIFNGDSYSTRDTNYDEVFDFGNFIYFSGNNEIVFDLVTGETSDVGDIQINSNNNETKTITINTKGMVDF